MMGCQNLIPFRQYRNPALDDLVQLYLHLGARRKQYVDTGPEFNKPHFGALLDFLPDMEIVHDPAGQSSGDLLYQDLPMCIADDHTVPLVLRRRFGMPGYQVFALMILVVGYL